MENILLNISYYNNSKNIHFEYIDMYVDLYIKHNIKTINLYKHKDDNFNKHNIIDKNYIKELEKKGIYLLEYKSNNLDVLIKKLSKQYNIIYVNTYTEDLISETTTIKKLLKQQVSEYKNIFTNKSIQRELLQKYNADISVKFLKFTTHSINLDEITNFIGYPFILKPSTGIQSSGVSKINNKQDFNNYLSTYNNVIEKISMKGLNSNIVLAEEFIDGEMYSIDYFVNSKQEIFISKPIKIELANKLGINDFFNYSRIISKEVEKELENINLKDFIKENVIGAKIKNTFIHHEFKLTSKKQLKTIELNGRIGGFRGGMYYRGYDLNLFDFILGKTKDISLKNNSAVILIYSVKKGILKGFNDILWSKINKLDSVLVSKKLVNFIGKEIGLTKDGFSKVGTIRIQNTNLEQFKEDYNFIEKNYKKILIIN